MRTFFHLIAHDADFDIAGIVGGLLILANRAGLPEWLNAGDERRARRARERAAIRDFRAGLAALERREASVLGHTFLSTNERSEA